jgi:hypothetical protein
MDQVIAAAVTITNAVIMNHAPITGVAPETAHATKPVKQLNDKRIYQGNIKADYIFNAVLTEKIDSFK